MICEFCGYEFSDDLGRYGCPNCEGEGPMKSLLNIIKRAILGYQASPLEATINGHNECLERVGDRALRSQIIIARGVASKELARIRSEYTATFPPGKRFIWRKA